MKKNLFSIMMLAVAALFVACDGGDDNTNDIKINLSENSISGISFKGDTKTITITAPVAWSVEIPTADQKWLSVDPATGEANKATEVTFTVKANEGAARNCDVTVKATGAPSVKINVAQNAAPSEGDVDGPATVNTLTATVEFTPFVFVDETTDGTRSEVVSEEIAVVDSYQHELVYVGGDLAGDVAAEGNSEDKKFVINVANWGTYEFQYIAYTGIDDNGEYEGKKEGKKITIKFEAPATGATLTQEAPEAGKVKLVISNLDENVDSYQFFTKGTDGEYVAIVDGLVDAEDAFLVVSTSGTYMVKAVYSEENADVTVYGAASNEETVAIPSKK